MSKRDYLLFIEDIIDAIQKIEKYTETEIFETFSKNDMAVDAVIRNFEINFRNVWNTTKNNIPLLKEHILKMKDEYEQTNA